MKFGSYEYATKPEDLDLNSYFRSALFDHAVRVWQCHHDSHYTQSQTVFAEITKPKFGHIIFEELDDEDYTFAVYDAETDTLAQVQPQESESSYRIWSPDERACKAFLKKLMPGKQKNKPSNRVYVTESRYGDMWLKPFTKNIAPLERENYEASVIEQLDFMVQELASPEPTGRLTIINGPPGTGKTHALQSIPCHVSGAVVFVTPKFLQQLAEGCFFKRIESIKSRYDNTPVVMCVEDADECLAPRDGANLDVVSSVLNLSDGMVGRQLDLRIVLTTNTGVDKFEEALLRPGRLSQIIEIGNLSNATANKIAKRLNYSETFIGRPTLAEVYATVRGSRIKKRQDVKLGFHAG